MANEEEQTTLLNLNHKSLNAYWVDPQQPLIIPENPMHWRAHELQLLLDLLKKQASRNPAQFNSKNYIEALNEYTKAIEAINEGKKLDDVLDKGTMDSVRNEGAEAEMGDRISPSMGSRVSADNPLTR